jgi:hypothetical protein
LQHEVVAADVGRALAKRATRKKFR